MFQACTSNSKCNGVTRLPTNKYVINTGSSAVPKKDSVAFIKSGESEVTKGRSWTKKKDKSLGGLSEKEYTNKEGALTACASSGSCKGVVKTKKGKYKIATSSKLSKKTGYTTWEIGSTTLNYGDWTWSSKKGYTLVGYVSKKVYPTKESALMACGKNDKCKGVTQEESNKFMLNTGSVPKIKKGRTCYLQGGLKSVTRSIAFGGRLWVVSTPYKFSSTKIATAKSRDKALKACLKNKKCVGFTRVTGTYYTLHNSYEKAMEQGAMTYTRRGKIIATAGFLWGYLPGYKLSGYDSSKKYATAEDAFSACTSSSTCKGSLSRGLIFTT